MTDYRKMVAFRMIARQRICEVAILEICHVFCMSRLTNSYHVAIIKAKDFEIAALKSQLYAATSPRQGSVNYRNQPFFSSSVFRTDGKNNVDSKQVLRVQERIESIQKQEIAALKKVIKIQRAIIKRNGILVDSMNNLHSQNSNVNKQDHLLKGECTSEGRLIKGIKRYEAPTVSSILHTSPKRSLHHSAYLKSNASLELQKEAKKILKEFAN